MALLFTDGFNDKIGHEKWSTTNLTEAQIEDPSGRHGLCAFLVSNHHLEVNVDDSTELILGFAYRHVGSTQNAYYSSIAFISGGSSPQAVFAIKSDNGHVRLRRGIHNSPAVTSSVLLDTTYYMPDRWVYVELRTIPSPTVGQFELRIDGATIANLSDVNTGTQTQITGVLFDQSIFNGYRIDDVYLLDTTGPDNNDFLGDVEIRSIYPSGAGNRTQMINADETQVDNFSYVNTPGDEEGFVEGGAGVGDLYEMDNVDAGAIHGVIQYHKSKMSDTGVQKARHLTRYDGADYEGPDANLGFSYNAFKRIWEKAPDDTEWTPAKLNATEMGVEGRG